MYLKSLNIIYIYNYYITYLYNYCYKEVLFNNCIDAFSSSGNISNFNLYYITIIMQRFKINNDVVLILL